MALRFTVVPRLMKNGEYGMSRMKTQGEVDTLFVGSSMFRQGIDTDSLATENRSMFLLAYNGNQPWMEWAEIEDLVKNGVKMKTLVVDMYAFSITADAEVSDVRIFQDASPSFTGEIYRALQTHGEAGLDDWYEMNVKANNEIFVTWPVSFPIINSRYRNGSNTASVPGVTNEALDKMTVSSRGETLSMRKSG